MSKQMSSFFDHGFVFTSQILEIRRFLLDKAYPDENILQISPGVGLGWGRDQARSEGVRQGLGLF